MTNILPFRTCDEWKDACWFTTDHRSRTEHDTLILFSQLDLAWGNKIVDKSSPSFELVTSLESLNFTHTFTKSGRKSVYFGEFPYSYAGGQHQANPLNTNQYVFEMFCFMCRTYLLTYVTYVQFSCAATRSSTILTTPNLRCSWIDPPFQDWVWVRRWVSFHRGFVRDPQQQGCELMFEWFKGVNLVDMGWNAVPKANSSNTRTQILFRFTRWG